MTHETDPTGRSAHDPGSKLDAGKPRPALVLGGFARALSAVTQVGTFGATKYTPNGWRTVPNGVERYTEAMVRHYLAEAQGLESDPDSHLLHAAHLAWNALARLELMLSGPKQQDVAPELTLSDFKVGQVWRRRDGQLVSVQNVYPDSLTVFAGDWWYHADGKFCVTPGELDHPHMDLVELIAEAPETATND